MKAVKLKILANDIKNTKYFDRDCAITRALHRAGYTNLDDHGVEIVDECKNTVITREDPDYLVLSDKVSYMYINYIKAKDFEVILNLDIE